MDIQKYFTKFIGLLLAVLVCAAGLLPLSVAAAGAPALSAETAILIDVNTGQILMEKGMNKRMYPASLTKIMTALLALEEADTQEVVTMSYDAVFSLPYGCSHIALTDGEQLTLLDALYATMLPSANDAANGVAEHIGGSMEDFAQKMNQRAVQLGAKGTHFVNPSGLPDPDHYTTAYDLALITMEALKQPLFREIWGTVQYTMGTTNKQNKERYLWNQTGLLVNNGYYYEDCTGGKLGWTQEAKHTLAAVAERDGRTLLCILMKNQRMDDNFKEAAKLFDYGFDQFTQHTITAEDITQPPAVPIYQDGQQVGQMLFSTREQTLLLTDGVLPHEVTPVYDMPDQIEYGDAPTASVTYVLPNHVEGQYTTVGVQKLLITGQELYASAQEAAPRVRPLGTDIQTPIWTMVVMVLCFGIASVLLSLKAQMVPTKRSAGRYRG